MYIALSTNYLRSNNVGAIFQVWNEPITEFFSLFQTSRWDAEWVFGSQICSLIFYPLFIETHKSQSVGNTMYKDSFTCVSEFMKKLCLPEKISREDSGRVFFTLKTINKTKCLILIPRNSKLYNKQKITELESC